MCVCAHVKYHSPCISTTLAWQGALWLYLRHGHALLRRNAFGIYIHTYNHTCTPLGKEPRSLTLGITDVQTIVLARFCSLSSLFLFLSLPLSLTFSFTHFVSFSMLGTGRCSCDRGYTGKVNGSCAW